MSKIYIDSDVLYLYFVEKGQKSKRYKVGDFWELNAKEIREVIDTLPRVDRVPGTPEAPYSTYKDTGYADMGSLDEREISIRNGEIYG